MSQLAYKQYPAIASGLVTGAPGTFHDVIPVIVEFRLRTKWASRILVLEHPVHPVGLYFDCFLEAEPGVFRTSFGRLAVGEEWKDEVPLDNAEDVQFKIARGDCGGVIDPGFYINHRDW